MGVKCIHQVCWYRGKFMGEGMKYGGIKQEKIRGREGEKTSEVEGGRGSMKGSTGLGSNGKRE